MVLAPARGAGSIFFQRLRSGGALLVRRLAKLVGSDFLDDAGAFLVDFQDALAGFLVRAEAVDKLLRGPDVGFLLVLAPVVAAVDEALYFHDRLRAAGIQVGGFVANRVQPAAGLTDVAAIAAALQADAAFAGLPAATIEDAATTLAPVTRAFGALHASERRELARLGARAGGISITEVPLFDHGVDNLAELRVVGEHLSSGLTSPRARRRACLSSAAGASSRGPKNSATASFRRATVTRRRPRTGPAPRRARSRRPRPRHPRS